MSNDVGSPVEMLWSDPDFVRKNMVAGTYKQASGATYTGGWHKDSRFTPTAGNKRTEVLALWKIQPLETG